MNTTAAARSAVDAYLALQADLGTDEVILPAPFRKAPAARPADSRAAGAHAPGQPPAYPVDNGREPAEPRASRPAARDLPVADSLETFAEIAARLAEDSRSARPARAAAPPPPPLPAWHVTLQPQLDALRDLGAYWAFVDRMLPEWFPGTTGPAMRAEGHPSPRLAVVEFQPGHGALFAGESGILLDKMMRAIGLSREDLYLTALMKTPPKRAWARKDAARMVPVLLRELRLAGCQQVLLLGSAVAEAVLKKPRAPEAMCATAVSVEGLSVSATWHPSEIAADPAASNGDGTTKAVRPRAAKAWEHLQWLRGLLPARGS